MINQDTVDLLILDIEAELREKLQKCKPGSPLYRVVTGQLDIIQEIAAKIEDLKD